MLRCLDITPTFFLENNSYISSNYFLRFVFLFIKKLFWKCGNSNNIKHYKISGVISTYIFMFDVQNIVVIIALIF